MRRPVNFRKSLSKERLFLFYLTPYTPTQRLREFNIHIQEVQLSLVDLELNVLSLRGVESLAAKGPVVGADQCDTVS